MKLGHNFGLTLAEGATHIAPERESKPSRGMNVVRGEQESAETSSFRCDCERCRLSRGAVSNNRHPELVSGSPIVQIAQQVRDDRNTYTLEGRGLIQKGAEWNSAPSNIISAKRSCRSQRTSIT